MRKDGVPRRFQLAGHTIEVITVPAKRWKHGRDCIGVWLPNEYRIELVSSIRGTNRVQTFVHEMLHALFDVAGYSRESRDETRIDRLAHLLHQILVTME